MRIVIGVTYSYPYIGSGIGNVAVKQGEELAKLGHKVIIISSNVPKYKKEFTRNKVKYIKGKLILRLEKIGLPIPLFFLDKKMKKAIREADIVHIHDSLYPSSYQIARYAHKYNKSIVLNQHIGFVDYNKFFYRQLSRLAYKTIAKKVFNWSEKIIILNFNVKKDLQKMGVKDSELVIVPNGVDTNLFKPVTKEKKIELRKKYNLPLNKPIVLFVGRLVAVKAFERLFDARDKDYLVLFVGGGEIPNNMKNNPDVLFLGEQTQEKLIEIYQLSDVFCLPSKSEGFPLSVLEAMASGLPSIVSDLSVYHEYFDKKSIHIIDPNPEEIKKTIKYLLKNKSRMNFISKLSRKYVVTNFTWKINTKKLLRVYGGIENEINVNPPLAFQN